MKVEVLFPEFCNLYGDLANILYLRKCIPEAIFIETNFEQEPAFVTQEVNLIYLGPMTEKMQERTIEKLRRYKKQIQQQIEKGTVFLLTGNSFEILGKEIQNEDGSKIEALGILDIYAKRDMMHRFNDMILGTLEEKNVPIVGFKNQFTQCYGKNEQNYFIKTRKGSGINKDSILEGIRIHNLIGTYLLGPICILNPLFTKYLLKLMGIKEPKLAFEEEMMKAYEKRLEEFEKVL